MSQEKSDVEVLCTFVGIVLLDIRPILRIDEGSQCSSAVGDTIVVVKRRLYDLTFGELSFLFRYGFRYGLVKDLPLRRLYIHQRAFA